MTKDFFSSKQFFLSVMTAVIFVSVSGIVFSLDKIIGLSKQVWKAVPDQQIYVTGVSKVYAMPDIATVSYSLKSEAKDVKKATDNLSKKIGETIDAFVAAGIKREKIYLTSYQTNGVNGISATPVEAPTYNIDTGNGMVSEITQQIAVEITGDKATLNERLMHINKIAFEKGLTPNTSGNFICLDFSNPVALFGPARKDAVLDATRQARSLVDAAELTLGRIISINENMYGFGGTSSPYGGYCSTGLGSSSVIEEQVVPVSVSVTFEVK